VTNPPEILETKRLRLRKPVRRTSRKSFGNMPMTRRWPGI